MIDADALAWDRMDGLLPAVVQDADSGEVRMLGYMNRTALDATLADRLVTFFSRSRNRLWRKGESSGNTLALVDVAADCDGDALLVIARPAGPTCHTGTTSCFGDRMAQGTGFLDDLAQVLAERAAADPADSYTARLINAGIKRVAQKVGEEGVESALAAVAGDADEVTNEAADLVYHLTLMLQMRDLKWGDVMAELRRRHAASSATVSS